MRMFVPALFALGLVGCADAPKEKLVIKLVPLEDGLCSARVNGEVIENEHAVARFKSYYRDHDEVVIIGPGNTEYRCIGSIIWHLQRAGFRKINFQIEAGS